MNANNGDNYALMSMLNVLLNIIYYKDFTFWKQFMRAVHLKTLPCFLFEIS